MKPLIEVKELRKFFRSSKGLFSRKSKVLKAVDQVSFNIQPGKTLGIVGESGCGKSTLGRTLLQLYRPDSGEIWFDGKLITGEEKVDNTWLRRGMQMIFQDPYSSLNPRLTVYETLREPLDVHRIDSPDQRHARVLELIDTVGLSRKVLGRYPHEFSGGQRQRVGIARALALRPKFIVADEPVSALDVSVQAQVLNLLADLQQEFKLSFMFIAHDLAVVQHISHEIGVMYLGKMVEQANAETLYAAPKHPYTRTLLAATPKPYPNRDEKLTVAGEIPSPLNVPRGCPFHDRCPSRMAVCTERYPEEKVFLDKKNQEHRVSCHLYS